ncbi:ATP-dependent RNA helicase TDRD9-like isoform X2 [Ruditapes philippinarum]|nr:ATP-dependent RNA helicase TDRD9-like isoform X2 [Ruditapes philippinarum]
MSMVSSHLEALELDSTIAGTEVLPSDLAPENATQVYGVYNFNHRYDDRLPISRCKEQVVNTIESNQVTVIQGATGSGKTTQVAQYILDYYAKQNQYCNIIVTQPRRIAAISIARRVCQERNWQLGTICGYQVGLDREAGDDTRILYCTTGILLNKLINEKNMHKYTHVILDEVHERDQDTDFSLLVVRKLLRTNSRHTKVVLMSATFDSEMFAQYFAMPVRDRLEQAPVVDVEGKPFKVNEYYAEDLIQLGPIPPLEESDPHISQEARNLAVELIQHFDRLEEKEQGLDDATGFAPIRGTVLVFLPGLAEIGSLEEALFKLSAKHQLRLIPLHSTITMEEQAQVFCQPCAGFRKVILSTNIAESSITVPDIKYVIDFCLTKNLVCDFDTNYTSLQVHWASVANCTQRKGRAGRVSNGRVYRLVTRHFFEHRLPEYGTPEMRRCPLDKLILQVKVLDLGEPKAILALALSPPNLDDIERNILTLKEVGALSTKGTGNPHDGELTFVGRVLAELPVDTKIGKMLMLGHVFGLLEECLIIGAAMSLKSVFAQPFKLRLEAYRHKLEWANGSQSDSIAILNAYKTWERKREQGEFKRSGGGGEVGWGKNYYLQIRRLKEIQELIKDIEKRLMKFNIMRPQHAPVYAHTLSEDQEKLLLKVVLCGAFYPNYFVKGEIDEMESLKALSGRDPLNTVMVKGLPANQGTLYKQVVEDLFRKCGANPKAYFEETRAYVEFPRRANSRSKVHEGVYMALKMKQLRMPMVINLYTPEEAREMLSKLQDAQDKLTKSGSLRTNRLTATGQITEESGSNRVATHVSPPDPAKDVISICITEVIDCGHFWAQYGEDENYRDLYKVQEELNKDHGHSLRPLSGVARVGVFCVAPYMDETLEYYRARIQSVQNKVDERVRARRECVEVFFVDYGNTAEVSRDQLRELPTHLLKTPFQAFECRQIKIRPSPLRCPDGKWTVEATTAFREMVLNHKLIARPFSVVHGVLRVDLIHITQQHGQFYVRPRLVEMGFADEAEESSLSKQSYEQRVEEYMKARNLFGRATQKGTLLGEPKADWLNVASLGATGCDLGARQKGNRVHLNGPTNPYEMSFFNMTNVGRLRATKIEQDSVNSISIDDEPHDPHQRMMVAGFVGLNPNGSSVVARDSTIMPSIPGLPALILLMFTPVAEFRVDPQKTRYIGAICGLGTDPVYGHSELPDHDIEVPFDVKFNDEDISKINAIRMAINFAIGNQTQVAAWGPDAVCRIQNNARKKMMELIQKRRDPCEVISPQRIYEWNQVDPDDVIPHSVDVGDEAQLLNYHSAIQLDIDDSDVSEITKQKEMMLKHVQYLRQVVKSNTKRTPTLCELCDVSCPTTQLLALHLEMQKHKRNEENFT